MSKKKVAKKPAAKKVAKTTRSQEACRQKGNKTMSQDKKKPRVKKPAAMNLA